MKIQAPRLDSLRPPSLPPIQQQALRPEEWITADGIRNIILNNEKQFLKTGLTTIEAEEFAPTWTHIECRLTGLDHILIIKPRYQPEKENNR